MKIDARGRMVPGVSASGIVGTSVPLRSVDFVDVDDELHVSWEYWTAKEGGK